MKSKIAIALLSLFIVINASAQALVTNSYFQSVNTDIPDDNPNGVASGITVTGIVGTISDIHVTLNITNGYNGDLYGYLVNSNGGMAILFNRVGVQTNDAFGYSDSGFHITFSSLLTNDIHFYQNFSYTVDSSGALLGTWAADGRNIDPASDPTLLANMPRTDTLGSFLGMDPNGEWTLFLADLSGGFQSTWQDWQLDITSVPEPASTALSGLGVICGALMWRYRRRRTS